jgi:hypothetical protein
MLWRIRVAREKSEAGSVYDSQRCPHQRDSR